MEPESESTLSWSNFQVKKYDVKAIERKSARKKQETPNILVILSSLKLKLRERVLLDFF